MQYQLVNKSTSVVNYDAIVDHSLGLLRSNRIVYANSKIPARFCISMAAKSGISMAAKSDISMAAKSGNGLWLFAIHCS